MDSAIDRAKGLLEPLTDSQKKIRCPFPDHEDRHPSAVMYPTGFFCFSCSRGGDSLDLFCLVNGFSLPSALQRLGVSDAGAPPPPRDPLVNLRRLVEVHLAENDHIFAEWQTALIMSQLPWADTSASVGFFTAFSQPSVQKKLRDAGLDLLRVFDLSREFKEIRMARWVYDLGGVA